MRTTELQFKIAEDDTHFRRWENAHPPFGEDGVGRGRIVVVHHAVISNNIFFKRKGVERTPFTLKYMLKQVAEPGIDFDTVAVKCLRKFAIKLKRQGVHKTIAAEANIGKPALFSYFDKHELMR